VNETTPIHRILASPYVRTLQTASAIAEQLGLKIGIEYGIIEFDLGHEPPDPLPIHELAAMFPHVDPSHVSTVPLPAEKRTMETMHDWYRHSITQVAARFPTDTLILVTHAAPLIALARGLVGNHKLSVRTGVCSVTKLVFDDSRLGNAESRNGNEESRNGNGASIAAAVEGVVGEKGKSDVEKADAIGGVVAGQWVVELDGGVAHLSGGEKYHWQFPE